MAKTSFFSDGESHNIDTQDFQGLVRTLDQRNADAIANNALALQRATEALEIMAEAEIIADATNVSTTANKTAAQASQAAALASEVAAQGHRTATAASEAAGATSAATASTKAAEALSSASAAAVARDATYTARDNTYTARDATYAARDTATTKAGDASASAATATSKANQLSAQLYSFNEVYLGKFAAAPTLDGNGNALKVGAMYENTTTNKLYVWQADLTWHAYDESAQTATTNAALSATNAAGSASTATASKDTAVTQAGIATTKAGEAATSATNAATSATNAAGSATTATTKAGEAATSATNAANSATTAANTLASKAPIDNPTFTGTVGGITKAMVGLGNADNTSDVNKPVSTAQQNALNLKASLAGAAFAGALTNTSTEAFRLISDAGYLAGYNGTNSARSGYLQFNSGSESVLSVDLAQALAFRTNAAERMRVSVNGNLLISTTTDDGLNRLQVAGSAVVSGNIGIGTATYTQGSALQLGRVFSLAHDINSGYLGSGWFGTNSGGATYAVTGNYAVRAHFDSAVGNMLWLNAAAGTAGNVVSFVERMRLTIGGNLLVATNTDNGADKVQVGGSGRFAGKLAVGTSSFVSGSTLHVEDAASATTAITVVAGANPYAPNLEFRRTTTYAGTKITASRNNSIGGFGLAFSTTVDNAAEVAGNYAEQMRMTPIGDVGLGTINPSKYNHGGSARVLEVCNKDTSPNAQAHLMLNSSSILANSAIGTVSFVMPNVSNAAGMMAYIGAGTDGTHTSAVPTSYLAFANRNGGSTGPSEVMRIDPSGNLLVGATSGNNHSIRKNVVAGSMVLGVGPSAGESHRFYVADTGGANAATTVYSLDKIGGNGRSINAAGTLNASGADYAEYMTKAEGVNEIPKGAVVGVDASGNLTDRWADAISFVLKSTDPSYVGGDTWGTDLEGDELEAARSKVDRIAFAGQVPVNVWGASPGQFIVPQKYGDKVGGIPVNQDDLTMKQYINAVGIVQNILPDGRANVRVKVA